MAIPVFVTRLAQHRVAVVLQALCLFIALKSTAVVLCQQLADLS
jgi:hypothetical protein